MNIFEIESEFSCDYHVIKELLFEFKILLTEYCRAPGFYFETLKKVRAEKSAATLRSALKFFLKKYFFIKRKL